MAIPTAITLQIVWANLYNIFHKSQKPPITYYAEADYDNALTTSAINEYNTALKSVIKGTKAKFLDFHSVLTAPDGYYYEEYHEMDGIHFMGSTYQVMLSFLEKHS